MRLENDLAYIDDKICNYYEIGAFKSDEEMAARDQEVAGDVQKPDSKGRRAREPLARLEAQEAPERHTGAGGS